MTEREFIQSIRQDYCGLRDYPRVSLANSIKTLADDLYAKDTHFIFELIQNAEDNDYDPNKKPTLQFKLCQQQLNGRFGPVLIVHNNEVGFQEQHVQALCRVGDSTKKKAQGYIGEKGIGFKSVFRITKCPYIFSNGFRFCLPEHDQETGLGYIVPQWMPELPARAAAKKTTIIIPLDKDEGDTQTVARALRDIAPETILFLDKLNAINVSVELPEDEHEVEVEKHILADMGESRLVELTYPSQSGADEVLESTHYWVTEVEFQKPAGIDPEKRVGIESRTVSVAIPLDSKPNPGNGKLFAYLPVWEDTGLPFLINADFLLVSSREGLREDEAWNKWLRDCITETYVKAFLSLVNAPDLPVEFKFAAYASLPLETHRPFLAPVIEPIQKCLENQDCVLVLPDGSLQKPSRARLCYENFRAVLGSPDSFPRYFREDAWLVSPELERFSERLKAIGVRQIWLSEVESCLQDAAWVQGHDLAWFISLFRYLQSQKFDPATLQGLAIVPVAHPDHGSPRYSCDKDQPIYFSRTEANRAALSNVPDWLSELVPIAFLDAEFLHLLDREPDGKALREWLTETLNIYDFSVENYCVDVLSKLEQSYSQLENDKLVEATAFLAQHVGSKLDWEDLPIILSDGCKMLLGEARSLTYRSYQTSWRYTDNTVQGVVVPESYDLERGWQHIWRDPEDRRHFVWLSCDYDRVILTELVKVRAIIEYPLPEKNVGENTPVSVTEVIEDYQAPRTPPTNGAALVKWLAVSSKLPTKWPDGTNRSVFLGETFDIEWANKKTYYTQSGRVYQVRTGSYQFRCSKSSFLEWLIKHPWLSSTKGPVRPAQAFLPRPGIKEVFGDTVPYFEEDLPENILRLLGVRSEVTMEDLLALLSEHSGSSKANPDLVKRIYSQLAARFDTRPQDIRDRFSSRALIFDKGTHGVLRWCKSGECVWEDASAVLGDKFAYLQKQYPELQRFFIEKLGVKRKVDPESFAHRWLKLQNAPIADAEQQRALVERLYREIKPIAQLAQPSRPAWWCDFAKRFEVYTQSDTFERSDKVFLPDDGMYREMFQEDVPFAWRPKKDAFNDWASFYQAIGTPLLSETVTEHLGDGGIEHELLPRNQSVTEAAVKMIAVWLREKQRGDYDRLLKNDGFAQLAAMREARTASEISVEFRLTVGTDIRSKVRTYPVFWKRAENILSYSENAQKSDIAKVIAKGLLENRAYKELARWIELVLEASDTDRLKGENWSVPQEILTLFSKRAPVSASPAPPQMPDDKATPTESGAGATEPNVDQPVQEAPPSKPAPDQPSDQTGASKDDVQGRTIGPSSSGGDARQGAPSWPRRTQQPPHVKPRDLEPATAHHDRSEVGKQDDSIAVTDLDFAASLRAAFDRPGCTKFDDADQVEADDPERARVKNPQRRSERLATGYREHISDEPTPEDRRRITERSLLEGPNEAVRVSLDEWYHGKCQICGETWPKQDGDPYFAAAYLVERRHAQWLDEPGNAICLCAEHFAQWRHAAKEMPLDVIEQIRSLRLRAEGGGGNLSIEFILLGADVAITYDERHLLALRTLVEVAGEGH